MVDGAFTRNRFLSFSSLIAFQLSRSSKSTSLELEDYFIRKGEQIAVDKSAYRKARLKLDAQVYERLNAGICDIFYHQANIKKWKGFKVKSVDGSTVSTTHQ